jgi:class 3 adenylate cyclase
MLPDEASGTLTFLFTDLEGSTRLWERFPQAMKVRWSATTRSC